MSLVSVDCGNYGLVRQVLSQIDALRSEKVMATNEVGARVPSKHGNPNKMGDRKPMGNSASRDQVMNLNASVSPPQVSFASPNFFQPPPPIPKEFCQLKANAHLNY